MNQIFERKHQHLEPTEAGRPLLLVVNKSFDRIEHLLKDILKDDAESRRVLHIQMPSSFAHNLAVPILHEFRNIFPDVMLYQVIPNKVGMPDINSDIAVVYSKPEVNHRIVDLLWHMRLTALCHPTLLQASNGANLAAQYAMSGTGRGLARSVVVSG